MTTSKKLTTDHAFEQLIASDYYWSLTNESLQSRRNYRHRLTNGIHITIDKKEELLTKAGFSINQVTTWKIPD